MIVTKKALSRRAVLRAVGATIDSAPIPMSSGPAPDRQVQFNDAFCAFVGRSREDILGLSWEALVHPEDVAVDREFAQALTERKLDHYTVRRRFVRSDGVIRDADVTVTAVRVAEGEESLVVTQIVDLTDVLAAQARAELLADYDMVTGLHSRAWITGHAARTLTETREAVAVMLIDLSEYLVINRTMGLEAADEALRALAATLQALLPEGAVLGRFEGNVLMAVVSGPSTSAAQELADRLVAEGSREFLVRDTRISRPVHVGVALAGRHAMSTNVIRDADLALSRAERHPDLSVEGGFRTLGNPGGTERGLSLDSTGTLTADRSSTGVSPGRTYSMVFRVSVPSNWNQTTSSSSVTYAPDGAIGASNGQSVFTHGVEFGIAQNLGRDLQTASSNLLDSLARGNPRMRAAGDFNRTDLGGRPALVRRMSNVSDATQQPETVQVITAQLSDGSLFYGIAVVPERDYNDYLPTFEKVFDSVRFLR